jgi:Putative MetA-pathway of phenol degradation
MLCTRNTVRAPRFIPALLASLGTLCVTASVARADEPKPDKSGYSLFNPTPDSALRDFAADRPAKSYGPTTIDAGRVQMEVELYNFTRQSTDGIRTTTHVGPNPTARVGITNNLELQVNIAPFVHQRVQDTIANTTTNASGNSDLFARAKINLRGNEGGPFALALIPYLKAGTAPESLGGNRTTEGGIIASYAFNLPNSVAITFNSEWDRLKNSLNSNFHDQFVQTAGISGPIAKDLTLTAEFWAQVNADPARTVRQYSFDTALAWTARPNLQLDVGANFGLNKDTPSLQVYTGITRRF